MKHTPGEWKVERLGNYLDIRTDRYSRWVARCLVQPEQEANAKLIAASPQMAKLLQRLVNDGWSADVSMEAKEILEMLD